jgi:hypothetical protein
MQIHPSELEAAGFRLDASLDHKEIVPFIRTWIKKPTLASRFYISSNLLIAQVTIILMFVFTRKGLISWDSTLSHFSYGLGIAFLLVPLHEYIHVLAYRRMGAKQTSYDAILRKFIFMALADQFVASRKEFRIVAMAPFLLISLFFGICLFFTSLPWTYTVLGILLTHTAFCSGDFGLLSYFEANKDKEVVTYDDKALKRSYFYSRINQNPE